MVVLPGNPTWVEHLRLATLEIPRKAELNRQAPLPWVSFKARPEFWRRTEASLDAGLASAIRCAHNRVMEPEKKIWGLLHRRPCLVPTWRGWLVLGLAFALMGFISVRQVHPFLAVTDPLPGGALVVEGWASDYVLEAALTEFQRNHYARLYVTGGPIERGAPLAEYKTYAELGAAILSKLGANTNALQAVPAPEVRQDRTYTAAVSLKLWLQEHGISQNRIHLVTEGPHARRSRLLFEKALGPGVSVGITAVPVRAYDSRQWWRYSAGVRGVTDEMVAYLYARFLFHPGKQ